MPIRNASEGLPATRTKNKALVEAMQELGRFYAQAKANRDHHDNGVFQILTLDSEEEAKVYGRAFHRLATNDNRVAQARSNGATLAVRLQPMGYKRKERAPRTSNGKPAAPAAKPATTTSKQSPAPVGTTGRK